MPIQFALGLDCLRGTLDGEESDLDPLLEGLGDPTEHRHRVPDIVRILELADDRGRGPDDLR